MCIDLAEVCINEEIHTVAEQRRGGRAVACGQEVGSMRVCKELGDKAGFENDLVEGAVGVAHCGDEAPLFGPSELSVGMVGDMNVRTGLTLRYHSSRGLSRSMMTSS